MIIEFTYHKNFIKLSNLNCYNWVIYPKVSGNKFKTELTHSDGWLELFLDSEWQINQV